LLRVTKRTVLSRRRNNFLACVLISFLFFTSYPVQADIYPESWEVVSTIIDVRNIRGYDVNSASDTIFLLTGRDLEEWGILNTTRVRYFSVPSSYFIKMDWNDEHRWMAWATEGPSGDDYPPWYSQLAIYHNNGSLVAALQPYGNLERNQNTTILDMQWCPGTSLLAVAYGDGTIMVYDISDMSTRLVQTGFKTPNTKIEWNPEGTLLAVISGHLLISDQQLHLIDLEENKTWQVTLRNDDITEIKWNYDGGSIFLQRNRGIVQLNLENEEYETLIDWDVIGFSPSPVESTIVFVDELRMSIFDVATGEQEVYGASWPLTDRLGWTADGSVLFAIDNRGVIRFWSRIPDRPKPTIGFLSPYEDTVLSGDIIVTGWASSTVTDISRLVFVKVGPTEWVTANGFEEWRYIINSTHFSDGFLMVRVRAEDPSGSSDIVVRRFVVNNTDAPNERPTIGITSPLNMAEVGPIVQVTGTASDDGGVQAIHYRLFDSFWRNVDIIPGGINLDWEAFVLIFHVDGEVRLSFRAFDGVHYSEEATITVVKALLDHDDNMTVSIEFPENGAEVPSNFRVSGIVKGPKPERVIVLLEDDTVMVAQGTDEWFIEFENMGKWPRMLRFRALKGDTYSPWEILNVRIGEGNEPIDFPPRVELVSPINGTVLLKDVDVIGKAMDDQGIQTVEYRLVNGTWTSAEGKDDWSFNIDVDDHEDGYIWVEVRSYDGTSYSRILRLRYYIDKTEDQDPGKVTEPIFNIGWLGFVLVMIIGLLLAYIIYDRRKRGQEE
jgi:WD40 repeat protein